MPAVADDHAELGLPVVIANRYAERGLGPRDEVGGERLTSARRAPKRNGFGGGRVAQRAIDGRRGGEVRDLELLERRPRERGGKRRVQQDAAVAGRQRPDDRV